MSAQENIDLTDTNNVLHVIRNPYGWNDHVVRDARLKAADLIEQQAKELEALRDALSASQSWLYGHKNVEGQSERRRLNAEVLETYAKLTKLLKGE